MAASPTDTNYIVEKREELMVSPEGGDPVLRVAHFLKPSLTSIDEPPFHPLSNSINCTKPSKHSLKISFNGWIPTHKDWKEWVTHMRSLHQLIWKEVGIHDAIINSTFKIQRNDDLIIGFARKWCCETNTFVFPWGEATITLEDMIMLGGYSVLGDSVFSPLGNREEEEIFEKLEYERIEFARSKSKKARQGPWLSKFRNSGSEIEHEAFLAFWLSRFVFPQANNTISKNVLPIAIRLARGTKMALAPAVLASIYRDLRLMKKNIIEANEDNALARAIWSPLQLVQVWVFERFPKPSLNPNEIENGDQLFARWDDKNVSMDYVRLATNSSFKDLCWYPYYGMWARKFYNEKDGWILVDCGLDEELDSFARCLRVSELVGIDCDCIEQYLPHRVAMQFGLGQDIPNHVPRANASAKIAWRNYTRPIEDGKLYFPSQFFEPCVTTRYLNWWNQFSEKDGVKVVEENIITCESSTSSMLVDSNGKKSAYDALVPPGFPPRSPIVQVCSSSDKGQPTIAKDVTSIASGNREPSMSAPIQRPSRTAVDYETFEKENIAKSELVREGYDEAGQDATVSRITTPPCKGGSKGTVCFNREKVESSRLDELEALGSEFEARMSKLEKVVAHLKAAAKLGHRLA